MSSSQETGGEFPGMRKRWLNFMHPPPAVVALWIRRFQVLQRTCWLSRGRNHCLSHVFSKQCEWVLYQKEVSPLKGDWVV